MLAWVVIYRHTTRRATRNLPLCALCVSALNSPALSLQHSHLSYLYTGTLPRLISFVCHSYANCRVCTQNSHSGILNSVLASAPSANSHGRVSRSAHSAFSVISALNPSFPFLATFNFGLSTSVSYRPIPFHFTLLRTLLPFFALSKNATPFFSSDSALFAQKKSAGRGRTAPTQLAFPVQQRLLSLCLVLPRIAGHGSRPTIL